MAPPGAFLHLTLSRIDRVGFVLPIYLTFHPLIVSGERKTPVSTTMSLLDRATNHWTTRALVRIPTAAEPDVLAPKTVLASYLCIFKGFFPRLRPSRLLLSIAPSIPFGHRAPSLPRLSSTHACIVFTLAYSHHVP
ncbi:hypothetical protein ONZ45_g18276 [Pleurotus djamor]|nr:hypothetical protein ONZ45_g18276 [Pleurotus djamor]